jgi:hypothetical protein
MYKKVVMLTLMILYIYTLTLDIFLNKYFRIPSPLILAIPLAVFYGNIQKLPFLYKREYILFFLCFFFYYLIGKGEMQPFFVYSIVFVCLTLYFNYFVGDSLSRYNTSILIFISVLALSTIVMLLNHLYPAEIDRLRYTLRGSYIEQSPSGIAVKIFTYGYQLAAFSTFLFIYTCIRSRFFILKILVFVGMILCIYWGMQRSVLLVFLLASGAFMFFYYSRKVVLIISAVAIVCGSFAYAYVEQAGYEKKDQNIFAKNEKNAAKGEEREDLVLENLKIFGDYPLGLIFYGKDWSEVSRASRVYDGGLTSHNAYLMFITYLGPFIGIALLYLVYKKIGMQVLNMIQNIKNANPSILIPLCFALLAASGNSFFHNDWLIGVNGPTIFLYFAILHHKYLKT